MTNSVNLKGLDNKLTSPDFWDSCYDGRTLTPFNDKDWHNYVSIQVAKLIESLGLSKKSICEVGGGDAGISSYFAKKYGDSDFYIIDFSPAGCALAKKRCEAEGVTLSIVQSDVFSPPKEFLKKFDLVFSFGVVEHFRDLASIMKAKKDLLKPDGRLFTLIPNFSGSVYAGLCERWSKSVFEDHVCHDFKSFIDGHVAAELDVVSAGYIGAVEFGMLSMAMNGPEEKNWLDKKLYLWLTRISKLVHLFETKLGDAPASKRFSPFMYVISRNK